MIGPRSIDNAKTAETNEVYKAYFVCGTISKKMTTVKE
jgi:hypothetical protein